MSSRLGSSTTVPEKVSGERSSHPGTPRARAVSTEALICSLTLLLSLKQRSPFRNNFIPSRRHSRQTDSVYRATFSSPQVPRLFTSFLPAGSCEPVYRQDSRFARILVKRDAFSSGGNHCAGSASCP